jgi:hypothetical protein
VSVADQNHCQIQRDIVVEGDEPPWSSAIVCTNPPRGFLSFIVNVTLERGSSLHRILPGVNLLICVSAKEEKVRRLASPSLRRALAGPHVLVDLRNKKENTA